jgi:hypothetical protein
MRLRSLGTLGSIRTVPFTATVFCNVVDFALVQHAITSQLEAHAQCRTTRHRTFAYLREVKAFTHRHVATMLLCSEKILGLRSFLARSSCDQQGCTPQQQCLMQVPMEDCRHVCDLHRRHRTADGSWPPRAPIAPFCLRMGKICTAAVHQGSRGSLSPCWLVGAPGLRS